MPAHFQLATAIAMRFNNERLEGRGLPLPYSLLSMSMLSLETDHVTM